MKSGVDKDNSVPVLSEDEEEGEETRRLFIRPR
jgi:hypothetical protein